MTRPPGLSFVLLLWMVWVRQELVDSWGVWVLGFVVLGGYDGMDGG